MTVRQELKAKKDKASKRLFGFEPEVLAKEMEPIEEYDLTSGVLGGAWHTSPMHVCAPLASLSLLLELRGRG